MKAKLLRYQIDIDTKKKTIIEELDLDMESDRQLTATRARQLLRRAIPEWDDVTARKDGWPYLYKFRDERGKVFKAQRALGDPKVKGSYHHIWEHVEIWVGSTKAKPKKARKPRTPKLKKASANDVTENVESSESSAQV